jgi:hypothetical protein
MGADCNTLRARTGAPESFGFSAIRQRELGGAASCSVNYSMDDVLALDRPAVFPVTTDRPVLFGAFAWADIRGCLNSLTNQMPPVL